jgi:hypothetical protein
MEMSKRRWRARLVVGLAVLCIFAAWGNGETWAASPPLTYTNASLKGAYEVLLVVWTSPENVTNQAYLGILTFDGVSKVDGSFTINTGGTITTDSSFAGTYAVNTNGTGSLSITDAQNNTVDLALVISTGGVLQFLQTNPNGSTAVMNGTGVTQGIKPYSNASLKGSYSFLETKWDTTSDPNSSEPDSTLGLMTFNGAGKVTVAFTDEHKGTVVTTTGSGTYAVNANGTATASVTLSNNRTVTFAMVVYSAGKAMQFQGTNCGCGNAVLAGTATR